MRSIIICCALLLAGCSTTRRLGEGEVLYTGVKKMEVVAPEGEKLPGALRSAVEEPLSVKPNNPLWSPYIRTPLPIGLWAYNSFYTERRTGFRAWVFRNLGKEPVVISKVQPELRTRMVTDILDNHGYFGSAADYERVPGRSSKRSRLSYRVGVARPWTLGTIEYPLVEDQVTAAIDSLKGSSSLTHGMRYDVDSLAAERVRITNILRNNSYYYFRPDYIEYLADTTVERYRVDVRMAMAADIPPAALRPYRIGQIEVKLPGVEGKGTDSVTYINGTKISYEHPLRVRPRVLERSLRIKQGEGSRVDDISATLTNLTKLGIFRYVNMEVTPLDSLRAGDALDMTITAALDNPLDAELEMDFSSKSNSFIGPGIIFGVKHKNIFRGGEVLSARINGAYEWQTGNTGAQVNESLINSYELGLTTSLAFPRLIAPRFIPRSNRYDAHTTLQLGASLMNRPQFFRMMSFNGSMNYDLQSSPTSFHNISILRLTYTRLLNTTGEFDAMMDNNRAIAESFKNQFIPSATYAYTYNKHLGSERQHRLIIQPSLTTAGNILSGVYSILGTKGTKEIFGNPFSQFIKGVFEVKYYHSLGRYNTLAARFYAGAAHAYGNSDVLPYGEMFTIGGANSVRAFTIRSLGPGSYRPDADAAYGYFDQSGDFKLEANLELRFRIMGSLGGAVFVDAGNIWLLKKNADRPGGELGASSFFDSVPTATGVGLRYDLQFLVIRADLGIGIHTPFENPEKKGYYNISKFKDGLGFHLAIGYPF